MGFFKNPLKAHKKIAKGGLNALGKTSPSNSVGGKLANAVLGTGGRSPGVVPPAMRTGGNMPAVGGPAGAPRPGGGQFNRGDMDRPQRHSQQLPGRQMRTASGTPRLAEGGKVTKKKK